MADEIERALAFAVACGVDKEAFRTVDFYSSHEALLLPYEHAMTRTDSRTGTPYDTSAHMVGSESAPARLRTWTTSATCAIRSE